MFSCTYTGTCLRPSWTAIVWPTIAGTIVDARDHVLMTRFSRVEFIRSTLTSRCSAMKGPLVRERLIASLPPTLHDEFLRAFVLARLLAHRHLAPRRRRRATRRRARFAAAVRVIHR